MRLGKKELETLKMAQEGKISSLYAGRFTNNVRVYSVNKKQVISLINKNLLQEKYIGGAFDEIKYIPTELAKTFL